MFGRTQPASALSMADARRELAQDPSIRLVDVRSRNEYAAGHIPGSICLPLEQPAGLPRALPDKGARVFVYCLTGARSRRACAALIRLGYSNVTDIGGITQWAGTIERGQQV